MNPMKYLRNSTHSILHMYLDILFYTSDQHDKDNSQKRQSFLLKIGNNQIVNK